MAGDFIPHQDGVFGEWAKTLLAYIPPKLTVFNIPQTAGMWLDLGGQTQFDMINLDAGNWTDYPKKYKVSVSNDGVSFTDIETDTSDIGFGQKVILYPVSCSSNSRYGSLLPAR
ncbi:MAG: discoidin domain-containing protein [Treponema sp.]|jgi:hypothetical protein|nr:discoidin domain-containing protein [Treponema sp.]